LGLDYATLLSMLSLGIDFIPGVGSVKALIEVSDGDTDLPLVIRADKDTAYQSVISAMDVAGKLGFTKQSLPIQSTSGQ